MPIPANKSELKEAIQHNFFKLMEEVKDIPTDKFEEKSMAGHAKNTRMSPSNLLGYLLGWSTLVLTWYDHWKADKGIVFPASGYKWNDLGLLAQKFYDDYDQLSRRDLEKHLYKNYNEILQIINDSKEDELYEISWYKNYTAGRMIQLNTASPCKNARLRLRKWRKGKY